MDQLFIVTCDDKVYQKSNYYDDRKKNDNEGTYNNIL